MAALQLGLEPELVLVDLPKGEQKKPPYLQLNPNGRVPVLDDDGFLLFESRAIMQYLAEKTPGQTIYPQDPRGRADVNRWLFWCAVHFSPAIGVLVFENLVKGLTGRGAPDPTEVKRGEGLIAEFLPVLDAQLAGKTWVAQDRLTIADLSLATPLGLAARARVPSFADYTNVHAWLARVEELDAWKKTVPPW
jgi:glutathione S-transferase